MPLGGARPGVRGGDLRPARPPTVELRAGPSTYRQSDCGAVYAAAVERLRAQDLVYGCDCSRATFNAWRAASGLSWSHSGP